MNSSNYSCGKNADIFDEVTAFPKKENDFKNKRNLLLNGMPNHYHKGPGPEALTRQKQTSNNNIAFNGKNVQRVDADNYHITAGYEIADLADLKTSDAVDYPADLQLRDRTRQASREQVKRYKSIFGLAVEDLANEAKVSRSTVLKLLREFSTIHIDNLLKILSALAYRRKKWFKTDDE